MPFKAGHQVSFVCVCVCVCLVVCLFFWYLGGGFACGGFAGKWEGGGGDWTGLERGTGLKHSFCACPTFKHACTFAIVYRPPALDMIIRAKTYMK